MIFYGSHPMKKPHIPSPCTQNWEEMEGDEVSRFCAVCQKRVFHLSAMHEEEARATLQQRGPEGPPCVRFSYTPDGSVITRTTRYRQIIELLQKLAARKGAEPCPSPENR